MKLKSLVNEVIKPLKEKLVLKKHSPKNLIVVVSDKMNPKEKSAETYKARSILKKAGFRWYTLTDKSGKQINAWGIDAGKMQQAVDAINQINKSTDTPSNGSFEQFEELVFDLSTISKKSGLDQRIIGFLDKLKQEVDQARASDEFQRYINFAKKFRTYSFSNQMLIWIQKPDATRVAGFRTWKTLNRNVKRGAHGIAIFVPLFYKGKNKLNKQGSEEVQDAGLDKEVDNQLLRGFKVGHVFDISDTEVIPGKEDLATDAPQWHSANTPDEKAQKISEYVEDILNNFGIKYTKKKGGGEQGYAAGGEHINISSGVGGVNKLSTLVHELAHTLLHFPNSLFSDDQMRNIPRKVKEFQAEAVAAAVLDEYGFPYKHSANYIALWNEKIPELAEYSNMIIKATKYIIDQIDSRAEKSET